MLYITTRDHRDAYTAHKALHTDIAVDGGAYVPFKMPFFNTAELEELVKAGFSETVATILNRFFSCGITGWDVDFCIGRNAVKIAQMPHRLAVAELWHNPKGLYQSVVSELYKKITGVDSEKCTEWFRAAVRIAVLFGIYVQMQQNDGISAGEGFDISLPSDDFSVPLAAFYAREMGLPVETIICTGDEGAAVWDFVHLGELNTALIRDNTIGFERYIQARLGNIEVNKMIQVYEKKGTFRVSEDELNDFNSGMFCATASKNRCAQTINSVYRSNSYILDPVSAMCVGGLQDYRAKVGESKLTLVLSEVSPLLMAKEIEESTGISATKLPEYL